MANEIESRSGPMARWVDVLQGFLVQDEWGVRELASHTGISRSAVHRILRDMARNGLVESRGREGHYRIGPVLLGFAILLADRLDVTRYALPILEEVKEQTGETVILAIYAAARHQFAAVAAAESANPIRYIWGSLRMWNDLYVGSSGKGILAFLPSDEIELILAPLSDPIPGLRPISKEQLVAELAEARKRGYAVSHGERFAGAVGVSAPFRDASGAILGDLIVSWPDNRTSPAREKELGERIAAAATRLSSQLGFRVDGRT